MDVLLGRKARKLLLLLPAIGATCLALTGTAAAVSTDHYVATSLAKTTSADDVAVAGNGTIYLTESLSDQVRAFSATGTLLTSWGGSGSAHGKFIGGPYGLAVDTAGNVYAGDRGRVEKFTGSGGYLSSLVDSGIGNWTPQRVATSPTGEVFSIDRGHPGEGQVSRFGAGGGFDSRWVVPGGSASALAVGPAGDVYAIDSPNHRVVKLTPGGSVLTAWGSFGSGPGQFSTPHAIAVDPAGDVYVGDGSRIQKFDSNGTYLGTLQSPLVDTPLGLATDASGDLYVVSHYMSSLVKFTTATPPSVTITSGPPSDTANGAAAFAFEGVSGGTYECSVDDGPWAACKTGASYAGLQPGDHLFQVRETLAGLTGPAASYRWTINLPSACILKVARARVFVFTRQSKARLVIRYKAYKRAQVSVSYKLYGSKGNLSLGSASARFRTAGVFHLAKSLRRADAAKVRAATSMKVHFVIPNAPAKCERYYTKRLTIPKELAGQTVWFQSDSDFTP